MDRACFYCYAADQKSNEICRVIASEINNINWRLGRLEQQDFSDEINSADMVLIVADFNDSTALVTVEFMLGTAKSLGVLVIVFSIYPIQLKVNNTGENSYILQLDRLRQSGVIISIDEDISESDTQKALMLNDASSGMDSLSIKLVLAIKTIVGPIDEEELIGVDFANYVVALAQKGFYQTKILPPADLTQVKVTHESWLQARVIIVTIFLSNEHAFDTFIDTSTLIDKLLKRSEPLWLCAGVIDEQVKQAPMISIVYKL